MDFGLFGRFLTKKQPKLTKNEENWRNQNRLMKFSDIWYVDASQQKNNATKNFFWISAFFGRFLTKKQPKLKKSKENWQNPNRLMKFSKIWHVDASQQNKMLQTNFFGISNFFWPFFNQKTAKIDQNEENWQNLNRLMKFSEIWYVMLPNKKIC